ncbi:MAG: SPOR domain-containing protein [Candidatus Omnitrophica bacterium]|nr:SPOR domain-containing protein [Candidatus Omnitrophota bacterium]
MSKFIEALQTLEEIRENKEPQEKEKRKGPRNYKIPVLIGGLLFSIAGVYYSQILTAPPVFHGPKKADSFYTIQLVTYKSEAPAKQEVARLAAHGLQAFVIPRGKFFVVCAEKFQTEAEALEKLSRFDRSFGETVYADAFVRFVVQ